MGDKAESFERSVRCIVRSRKYGRFRIYRQGAVFNLFERVKKYTDGFYGNYDLRIKGGTARQIAEALSKEYKGRP